MPYVAEISRSNPSAYLILIDQSTSMGAPFAGGGESKAIEAARVVNRFLEELTIKCAKSEGIWDYYHVGIIGYGRNVASLLPTDHAESVLMPISGVGDNPLRVDRVMKKVPDGAGGLVETEVVMPVWVDAIADGMTPMCQALQLAKSELEQWVAVHQSAFPPVVLNITDGEANDGDPRQGADGLRQIATSDGEVLLFNCHLSSSRGQKVQFPDSVDGLVDPFAIQLFQMSSLLPATQLEAAISEGFSVSPQSRGFVFNASLEELINFVDIGTRATLK